MFIRVVATASVALIAALSAPAARAYDQLIVFGDSLSDNGNVSAAMGGAVPAAPYANGRFSNGPVAVEVMASALHIPLADHAYGGALTGLDNQFSDINPRLANTGVRGQINAFTQDLASHGQPADASALYFVWGGGNDFLSVLNGSSSTSLKDVINGGVSNLLTDVGTLYAAGARDVMVPLLPDLATSYYGTSGAVAPAGLTALTQSFNNGLRAGLSALQSASPGLNVTVFDTPTFLKGVRDGLQASGGNVTDRCWTGDYIGAGNTAPVCANPDQYFLFDKVHPTAIIHQAVGLAMAQAAVPEPATASLVLFGLAAMGLGLRRRRRA